MFSVVLPFYEIALRVLITSVSITEFLFKPAFIVTETAFVTIKPIVMRRSVVYIDKREHDGGAI